MLLARSVGCNRVTLSRHTRFVSGPAVARR
jgi:hypothetical protein